VDKNTKAFVIFPGASLELTATCAHWVLTIWVSSLSPWRAWRGMEKQLSEVPA